jgi:hypothetical protein
MALGAAALLALAAAQAPATPKLNRTMSMYGTGFYSFGKVNGTTTAALYQDNEQQLLRIDLGDLSQAPPQLHTYFTHKGEHVEFLRGGAKQCIASKPDGSSGFSYAQQLAGYSSLDYYGIFSITSGGPGHATKVSGFAGKAYDGVRGNMAAVVFVDTTTSVLKGQLSMFDESCGQYWLSNATIGPPPDPSVFTLPAECSGGRNYNRPAEEQQHFQDSVEEEPPTLDLDKTLSATGWYHLSADPAGTPAIPSRWQQDSTSKQLLVAVGDTTGTAWKQVLLYNTTGQYVVALQQGNPVCERKAHPTYSEFIQSHAAPNFVYAATGTIEETTTSLGGVSMNMFPGVATVPDVEGGTEEVMFTEAATSEGFVRIYDNLNREQGFGRLILDSVAATKPPMDAFDLTKQIVSWLRCV